MTGDKKIPGASHGVQWSITLSLLAILVFGSELYWRWKGFMPRVADSHMLWSIERNRVYGDSTIVILGASRAHSDIDPDVMSRVFPGYKVVQLSVDGEWPFYALQDLANDPDFTGIILLDLEESVMINAYKHLIDQKPQVDYYRAAFFKADHLQERINTYLRAMLQNHIVMLSPDLNLPTLVQTHLNPNIKYYVMNSRRFRALHYTKMPSNILKKYYKLRIAKLNPNPKQAGKEATKRFQDYVKKDLGHSYLHLRQRGGRLILIRMPTSGPRWSQDNKIYPRKMFWNNITKWTGIPTIHFKDYPELSKFRCPETSHLDASDVPEFTLGLSRIVRDKSK